MRIDAHQHFWKYFPQEYEWIDDSMHRLRRDFLPADLKPELDANGFAGCVAVQARQSQEETEALLHFAEESSWILGVVGWVDLQAADARSQLRDLARNSKLVGIRHIVQSEPDDRFLMRPEFLRGIAALEEFGFAYDVLIYARHLPVASEFVQRFPRQRFVLDHLAKPHIKDGEIEEWARGIRRLASFENVFCKLSGLITEAEWEHWTAEQIAPYLDVAFEAFGAQRLIIGSDWPVCLVAGSYARTVQLVKDCVRQRAPQFEDDVLGNNAARFYHLKTR